MASGAVPVANSLTLSDEIKELHAQGITPQPFDTAEHVDTIAKNQTPECFYPYPNQPPQLWPCNAQAVEVFMALQTQWRVGMGGATGLDYQSLPAVLQMLGVKSTSKLTARKLFYKIQILEREFLRHWSDQRRHKMNQSR